MQTSTTSTDTSSAAPATFLGHDENGMTDPRRGQVPRGKGAGMSAQANVLAVLPTEMFIRGKSDFGFPVVRRIFVERFRSRWAVKSVTYFIDETPAWDYTTRKMPAGTVCGGDERWPFVWSTHPTQRDAIDALAARGG